MTLPLIIVNPTSAGGSTRDLWPAIASDLRTHFGPFKCAFTVKRGDARALSERGAREGSKLIVACGGDGTISEVANGILESGQDAELGILPSGTGGDFRRTLAIPTRPAAAAQVLRNGRSRTIDAGKVTYINHRGDFESRYFVGVASFGMSGEVINRVKGKRRKSLAGMQLLGGKASFAAAAVETVLMEPNVTIRIEVDGKQERRISVVNVCVANARYFGGGMKIAPGAKLDDGKLDLITIGDLSPLDILVNAPKLYFGAHLGMQRVHHSNAKHITARPAESNVAIALEIDGELPGRLPASFEIVPRALRIRCP
jgi:diacylglycerol kinase (ATP)